MRTVSVRCGTTWASQDRSLKFIIVNYGPNQVFYVEIYAVLEHVKWSHNELNRGAYGADTVSFSDERCPSYPVYVGPFPCVSLYDLHPSLANLSV